MRLYLVRHGEARSERDDPSRSLTDKGREEVKRVVAAAQQRGIQPSTILHSGKLRAQQTAELFAEMVSPPKSVEVSPGLSPDDPVQPWAERLNEAREDVMLVGHLPHLALLASLLLADDQHAEIIHFQTATLVCLERQATHWTLQWVLTPEMTG